MADSEKLPPSLSDAADIERRVASGQYVDAADVVRSAMSALDREDADLDDLLRAKVRASVDDPRPSIAAETVFARLRARVTKKLESEQDD